jgi:PilZ domain
MPLKAGLALKQNPGEGARGIRNGDAGLSNNSQATAKAYERMRRFSRHRFDARIQVSLFREGEAAAFWGRTSELGQDGIGATLSGELQIGEVVSLEFPIPLPPRLIKLRAVVRYSVGLSCGFEFLVVTDEQRLAIRQVCVMLANVS